MNKSKIPKPPLYKLISFLIKSNYHNKVIIKESYLQLVDSECSVAKPFPWIEKISEWICQHELDFCRFGI